MKAQAVRLDDQALFPPKKVRHESMPLDPQIDINLRPRKTRPITHSKEHPLQLTPGSPGLGMNLNEEQAKAGDSATPSAAQD
jgi:hypothetical protein